MLRHSLRRWLAGFAVAGAFVAATPTPAIAAGELRIVSRDLPVAPGHSAPGAVRVGFDGSPSPAGVAVTLDIDLSEWDALGTFAVTDDSGWDCARRVDTLHCLGTFGAWSRTPTLYFQLTARADAALDERAELTIRGMSAVGTATRTTTVTVVEGVDLVTGPEAPPRPGPDGTVGLTSTVRNAGPVPVRGAVLTLTTDLAHRYAGDFRNCRHQEGRPTVCRFDTALEPGVTYRLSAPLPLTLHGSTRGGLVLPDRPQWWTTDDWALVEEDPDEPLPPDIPGTGDELRLVEQPAANPTNDRAESALVPPVGGSGDGQGGGDDGSLPVTGTSTALTVAMGGLLLAAGVAGVVVARRRRTHFVA